MERRRLSFEGVGAKPHEDADTTRKIADSSSTKEHHSMQPRSSEETPQQAYLENLDRQVAAAHSDGAFTAVLKLANGHQDRLRTELADLTRGLTLHWVPPSEQTAPSPVEVQINRLQWQLRQWNYVAARAGEFAANEAHGWTILPDGTSAKVLDSGRVLSSHGGVRYEEDDGTIIDTSERSEPWKRRHERHARDFGDRVRVERLQKVRSRTRTSPRRRAREHRPGVTRRASSSSSTSSADPGPSDSDEHRPHARLCAGGCGRPLAPRSDNNCGAAACRKRIQRQRATETAAPATIGLGILCQCGCSRSLEGKRAGTKFFSASCCTKAWRNAQRDRREPVEADICRCESGFFYRDGEGDAICGLCGCWLAKRRDLRVDDFDRFDAWMRTNKPYPVVV